MPLLNGRFDVTGMEFTEKLHDPSKYNETLKKLCSLTSAENLSYLLHHLRSFSEAKPFNINIFKEGIAASWEDSQNVAGCSWSIQCKPEYSNALFEMLSIYFTMKGFQRFTCNGISANVRRNFVKFTIWSKEIPTVADGFDVLEELKDVFRFEGPIEFMYKNHKDLVEKVVSSHQQNTNQ
ncbi:eukaryotic translation initiation factor 4E [Glugoides intestinalis]